MTGVDVATTFSRSALGGPCASLCDRGPLAARFPAVPIDLSSLTDGPVGSLAQEVRVPVVACVLLDHVAEHPSQ